MHIGKFWLSPTEANFLAAQGDLEFLSFLLHTLTSTIINRTSTYYTTSLTYETHI